MNLELLIFVGGILHFGILIASALTPKVLDWKESLGKLDRLSQQLIGTIVITEYCDDLRSEFARNSSAASQSRRSVLE
jgi:hypothetical protein